MPSGRFTQDFTGMRFNHFLVLSRHHEKYHGQIMWLCRCDCGKEIPVATSDLKRGYKVKCRRDCPKFGVIKGVAAFNYIYNGYVKGARRRKMEFTLSKTEFKDITSQLCHYCGCAPSTSANRPELNGDYVYNGIDRLNNSFGYVKKNCIPCCWHCNRAKQVLSEKEFKTWIIQTYNHWASK